MSSQPLLCVKEHPRGLVYRCPNPMDLSREGAFTFRSIKTSSSQSSPNHVILRTFCIRSIKTSNHARVDPAGCISAHTVTNPMNRLIVPVVTKRSINPVNHPVKCRPFVPSAKCTVGHRRSFCRTWERVERHSRVPCVISSATLTLSWLHTCCGACTINKPQQPPPQWMPASDHAKTRRAGNQLGAATKERM